MNYKWTILFLVHASNKQTRAHVNELIKILKDAPTSDEIKLLILYGGLKCSLTGGYSNEVTLHEIIKADAFDCTSTSSMLASYGTIDIGDDKKIKRIFSGIKKDYPSERFLLFTWDHGSGFGIFKTDPRERDVFATETFVNFEMDIMKENIHRSLKLEKSEIQFEVVTNYEYEDDNNSRDLTNTTGLQKKKLKTSMLTNDELSNIIRYEERAPKTDLLIMMNCAMQLIETGYALNDAVNYLVAPQTCIFWAGYDYKSIIGKLCEDPDIETETIGRYAIDTIQAYYNKTTGKEYFDNLVVSLVKPSKSLQVKLVMDDVASRLTEALPDSFKELQSIRQSCEDLTSNYVQGVPYHYIDLLSYVADIGKITNKINVNDLKRAMAEYVVHIVKGKNYEKVNGEDAIGQVNGCTIYHPPTAQEADDDFYYGWFYKAGNQQTLFASQCLWKRFLISYFRFDREREQVRV